MVFNLDFTRDELETLRVSLCNREDILESRISRFPNENFFRTELERTSDLLRKLLSVG